MKKTVLSLLFAFALVASWAQSPQLKAMCFNIRYDNANDGDFQWRNRREAVVRMIEEQQPAILGLQEVLKGQLNYLKDNLKNYATIGVGRQDGKQKGEYSPLFYDTKRVALIKNGHFWLSQTPNIPSKGWDAACERIATWGVFEVKETGTKFICINTHFDHVGTQARLKSGELMLDSVVSLAKGLPVIIMGDFNTTTDNASLAPLLSKCRDARSFKEQFGKEPAYTYIGFDSKTTDRMLIDHIFVQGFDVTDYKIITNGYGVKQLSDHLPVVALIKN